MRSIASSEDLNPLRIAISGTHATGKSTLIEEFIARHPQYTYEPEPYVVLQEVYGETFGDPPTLEDFERQLELNLETIGRYSAGDDVIFERSPFDFVAYIIAIDERRAAEAWTDRIRKVLPRLDLLVFLPLDEGIAVPDSEDPELRQFVDELLQDVLLADDLNLFSEMRPAIVEARGTVRQRLAVLEAAL
jgi:hypothetical protein